MTVDDYARLLILQKGRCAICKKRGSGHRGRKVLSIDHDHRTGRVRGLLCHPCNMAVGHLRDSPLNALNAALYLLHT